MPRFVNVKLIAAIGNNGQIGHRGRLPWHDRRDLEHFKSLTMGGIVIVGASTKRQLPELPGREVIVWRRDDNVLQFVNDNSHRDIWIAGGSYIYRAWLPYVSMSIITHIDFNERVDTYMPHLWHIPSGIKSVGEL